MRGHPLATKAGTSTRWPPPQNAKDVVGLTYHDESLDHGDGPVQVSLFKSFSQLGLEVSTDPRSGTALGAFQNPATIDPATKTRRYAATAYYTADIAGRPNLIVKTESIVNRILFDVKADE